MSEITPKRIEQMIYIIRGQKVMLDSDLGELYEIETKMLKRAVRRNIERFSDDKEGRYQFGTSNKEKMG